MGLAHSPKIVTDGLVFAIDTGNDKSYKGPVMTNVLNQITQIGTGTANGYSFTASTESVFIPTVGTMTAQVNSGFNNYPAVSTGCCPALFLYGSFSVSPSTLYTYGILYKTTSGYSHPNFMYRYEYTAASAYVTEAGVHSTTNRIHLGDGWYWAWGTFTTSATTTQLVTYSFYYNYGTATDKMYVAKTLLAQGDYTKLHPRYWPDVNTSRSSTQNLIDLTNRSNITANSLTYANTGTFSFDGSSNRITSSTSLFDRSNGQEITVSCWIKPNRLAGQYSVFCTNRSNDASIYNWIFYQHTNDGAIGFHGSAQNKSSYIPTVGSWVNLTNTVTAGGVSTLYVNGISNYVVNGFTYGGSPSLLGIGADPGGQEAFQGSISNVNIYNRALSDEEVLQNFNALKGRFGL